MHFCGEMIADDEWFIPIDTLASQVAICSESIKEKDSKDVVFVGKQDADGKDCSLLSHFILSLDRSSIGFKGAERPPNLFPTEGTEKPEIAPDIACELIGPFERGEQVDHALSPFLVQGLDAGAYSLGDMLKNREGFVSIDLLLSQDPIRLLDIGIMGIFDIIRAGRPDEPLLVINEDRSATRLFITVIHKEILSNVESPKKRAPEVGHICLGVLPQNDSVRGFFYP